MSADSLTPRAGRALFRNVGFAQHRQNPLFPLCSTSTDCPDGETCLRGPYAGYCASVDGGAFAFPDGGFPFMRRDAAADDGAAPTTEADAGTDQ
jgi:hypothetical protein